MKNMNIILEYGELDGDFFVYLFVSSFQIENTFFRLISFKNSKPSVEAGIWPLVGIEYLKFDGNVFFFRLRLFPFSILMLTD